MAERNKTAMGLAIVAGIMLLIAGVTGVAMIEKLRSLVTDTLKIQNEGLMWVFLILLFLASLGGILVILGGVLIGKNKVGGGKFCITIGVGTGLIGLIVALILLVVNKTMDTSIGGILALVGIILSVAARMLAKKDESPAQPPQQQGGYAQGYGGQQPAAQQTPAQYAYAQQPQNAQQPYPQAQAQPQHQPQQYPQQQPYQAPAPQPAPQPKPQGAVCQKCGSDMRYIQQYGRWYCDLCLSYA